MDGKQAFKRASDSIEVSAIWSWLQWR